MVYINKFNKIAIIASLSIANPSILHAMNSKSHGLSMPETEEELSDFFPDYFYSKKYVGKENEPKTQQKVTLPSRSLVDSSKWVQEFLYDIFPSNLLSFQNKMTNTENEITIIDETPHQSRGLTPQTSASESPLL